MISDEEKTYVVLASTSIEYNVNKMDKRHYHALLQSIQSFDHLFLYM
jgi:hypothetical protein